MDIFQIEEPRPTLKAVGGQIRAFSPYPLLNSKLIPPQSRVICPITSDIHPGVVNLVAKGEYLLTLGNHMMTNILLNPTQEQEATQLKRKQYRFSLDDRSCFELTRHILMKAFDAKKEAVKGYMHLVDGLDADPFLELPFSPKFNGERWRTFMFNAEANISNEYWLIMKKVFEGIGWEFGMRSRRPAADETNALLNYGYAILLSKIRALVLAAGLDPFVGLLHTLRSGKPSLCLDLMEPFRPIVDQVVVFILHHKLLKKSDFDVKEKGVILGDRAKEVLSGKFTEATMTKHRYILQMAELVLEVREKIMQFS
ncbi:MAG: CRISPR-associated endonuclease Cas1 [Methanobacteriota archaeon]|nr:MAG: CRISPR-associated endonuclease Cas1 [Euryarchaeota archaeon]